MYMIDKKNDDHFRKVMFFGPRYGTPRKTAKSGKI